VFAAPVAHLGIQAGAFELSTVGSLAFELPHKALSAIVDQLVIALQNFWWRYRSREGDLLSDLNLSLLSV
jgi:hypothetical protein